MRKPFPWIWAAVVVALLAAPLLVDDPARAQFGAIGALIVATIPMRNVRGASVAQIAGVVAGGVIAGAGVWQAVKGDGRFWAVAGLGEAIALMAMEARVRSTFGPWAGRAYLVGLAGVLAAVGMYLPEAVASYGVKGARVMSAVGAAGVIAAAFTAGSSSRTRP